MKIKISFLDVLPVAVTLSEWRNSWAVGGKGEADDIGVATIALTAVGGTTGVVSPTCGLLIGPQTVFWRENSGSHAFTACKDIRVLLERL